MTNLSRRDPFSDLSTTMDRLFEGGFSRPWRLLQMNSEPYVSMPIEVSETADEIQIKASLPGVDSDDIDISVQGDVVTIKAESREDREEQQKNYTHREFQYGMVQRTIPLSAHVDTNRTEATFVNGVLRLRLGKSEEARPKRIRVQGGDSKTEVIDQSGGSSSQTGESQGAAIDQASDID